MREKASYGTVALIWTLLTLLPPQLLHADPGDRASANGPVVWERRLGGFSPSGSCVVETADGGLFVAGRDSFAKAIYLARTDQAGNLLEERRIADDRDNGIGLGPRMAFRQTADGGLLLAGSSGYVYADIHLLKTDASGQIVWEKAYGGQSADHLGALEATAGGGYVIAGETFTSGTSRWDVLLVEINAAGEVVWEKRYGGEGDQWASAIQRTVDGGYIVAGSTNLPRADRAKTLDVYLLKIDAAGNELWSTSFGGTKDESAVAVDETPDGGYFLAGQVGFYVRDERNAIRRESDLYLAKTDARGSVLWQRTHEEDSWQDVSALRKVDGGYVVAGTTRTGSSGDRRATLLMTDPAGTVLWKKTFGTDSWNSAASVHVTSDGSLVAVGTFRAGTEGSGVYLFKTNARGDLIWERRFGEKVRASPEAKCVRRTPDGGFVMTYQDKPTAGRTDVYLARIDAEGQLLWETSFAGVAEDSANAMAVTGDGGFLLAGSEGKEAALLKTDSRGKLQWKKTFGPSSAHAIEAAEGGWVLTGTADECIFLMKVSPDGTLIWRRDHGDGWGFSTTEIPGGGYTIAGTDRREACLLKTDAEGWVIWKKTYGKGTAFCVRGTREGGFLLAGYSRGSPPVSRDDWLLLKTDSDGNVLWRKLPCLGYARCVRETEDGGWIAAGSTSEGQARLLRTDADGNVLWQQVFGPGCFRALERTADGACIAAGVERDSGEFLAFSQTSVLLVKLSGTGLPR